MNKKLFDWSKSNFFDPLFFIFNKFTKQSVQYTWYIHFVFKCGNNCRKCIYNRNSFLFNLA